MPRSTVLALALLAAACGTEESSGIIVTTDRSLYSPDQNVEVTIANTTSRNATYVACPERWDRKTFAGYVRLEEDEVCPRTLIVTTVPAGGSAQATYTFPEGQPLGVWRIPIPVTFDGELHPTEAHSPDFQMVVFERN